MRVLVPLLVFAACVPDRDGDGIIAGPDCDDANPTIHPGRAEVPADGVDQDCDGKELCWVDADGDAFGSTAEAVRPRGATGCDQAGYAAVDGDCDDAEPTVHPDAPRLCDGLANACGVALPADEIDDDGDGFVECPVDGSGWRGAPIAGGDDCDDADPALHPGADWFFDCDGDGFADPEPTVACDPDTVDRCGTWSAEPGAADCDDDDPLRIPDQTWYADCDGDGFTVDTPAVACAEPETCPAELPADWVVTPSAEPDCDDFDAAVTPGQVWYVDCDGDGHVSDAPVVACGPPLGACADGDDPDAWVDDPPAPFDADCDDAQPEDPDVDDDGVCDLRDACPGGDDRVDPDGDGVPSACDPCPTDAPDDTDGDGVCDGDDICPGEDDGADWDRDGTPDGCDDAHLRGLDSADAIVHGTAAFDIVGLHVAAAGDVDGDGFADALASASGLDLPDADGAGAALLLPGPSVGTYTDDAPELVRFWGGTEPRLAGRDCAGLGDVDGDGYADLAIGAEVADARGTVFVVHGGPFDGDRMLEDARTQFLGDAPGAELGSVLARGGDADADTRPDLLLASHSTDTAYLLLAPFPLDGDPVTMDGAHLRVTGEPGGLLGRGLDGGEDVDADGRDDLIAGAPLTGGDVGEAVVFLGGAWGTLAPDDAAWRLLGSGPGEEVGHSVALVEDVDLDGLADVLIAAPGGEVVYLVTGATLAATAPTADVLGIADATFGSADGSRDLGRPTGGSAVADAGDVNGDGYSDLLLGDPGADGSAGAAYLVLGPVLGAHAVADADALLTGEPYHDHDPGQAGGDVAGLGDVDGDGLDDLIVGAYGADRVASEGGAAYVVLGADL